MNCQNCPYGSWETLIIITSAEWSPISALWKIKHKYCQSMLRYFDKCYDISNNTTNTILWDGNISNGHSHCSWSCKTLLWKSYSNWLFSTCLFSVKGWIKFHKFENIDKNKLLSEFQFESIWCSFSTWRMLFPMFVRLINVRTVAPCQIFSHSQTQDGFMLGWFS